MKRHVLIYGAFGGVLITVLKLIEYRFLVVEHSIEIYGGLVAAVFAVFGIWLGLKLTKNKETIIVREGPVPAPAAERGLRGQDRIRQGRSHWLYNDCAFVPAGVFWYPFLSRQ